MFDKERFIEECLAAAREHQATDAIRELVTKAVSDRAQLVRELGEPVRSGIETIYRGPDLTILNVCWGPRMKFHPHEHCMWAVLGIYGGCEQNTFFRRVSGGLTQHGTKTLLVSDTIVLGKSVIHAVANPLHSITGAIHVYGGDLFGTLRSEWNPDTFEEHPYDVEHAKRVFEEANRWLGADIR